MGFKQKYGPTALVIGASEGLGAAWATEIAKKGLDLVLVARRKEPLEALANKLIEKYQIKVISVVADLSDPNALNNIQLGIGQKEIGLLVYNVALSYIGPFLDNPAGAHAQAINVNVLNPLLFVHHFGGEMVKRGKGGIILMASLAGFQGAGFLTTYASTKAFDRVFGEGLWYEWKDKGVDVLACSAGATATPNYIATKPKALSFFAPKVQTPEDVVEETIGKLGKVPSFIPGLGNRLAAFFMHRFMTRKLAVTVMGDTTKGMYGIN